MERKTQDELDEVIHFGPAVGTEWRHKSGSVYTVEAVGHTEHDLMPCVVYRARGARSVWVRPMDEFMNRFDLFAEQNGT